MNKVLHRANKCNTSLVKPLPGCGKKELKNETEKINYSVGYQIGRDFKSQGVDIDGNRYRLKSNISRHNS